MASKKKNAPSKIYTIHTAISPLFLFMRLRVEHVHKTDRYKHNNQKPHVFSPLFTPIVAQQLYQKTDRTPPCVTHAIRIPSHSGGAFSGIALAQVRYKLAYRPRNDYRLPVNEL